MPNKIGRREFIGLAGAGVAALALPAVGFGSTGGALKGGVATVDITPPVGINVYVVFGVARRVIGEVPLEAIFKGILPFLIAVIVGVIILMIFPQIILFLPNLMY